MLFTVSVSQFNGSNDRPAKEDKNGLMPVVITSLDGSELPTRARVLSGTVAQRAGLEPGKSYMVNVVKTGESTYFDSEGTEQTGENYSINPLRELTFADLKDLAKDQNSVPATQKTANPFVG